MTNSKIKEKVLEKMNKEFSKHRALDPMDIVDLTIQELQKEKEQIFDDIEKKVFDRSYWLWDKHEKKEDFYMVLDWAKERFEELKKVNKQDE